MAKVRLQNKELNAKEERKKKILRIAIRTIYVISIVANVVLGTCIYFK